MLCSKFTSFLEFFISSFWLVQILLHLASDLFRFCILDALLSYTIVLCTLLSSKLRDCIHRTNLVQTKRTRLVTLIHKHERFKMNLEESIHLMIVQFTHIISHMITLGKIFSNDELVVKILRWQNCSWKPKLWFMNLRI